MVTESSTYSHQSSSLPRLYIVSDSHASSFSGAADRAFSKAYREARFRRAWARISQNSAPINLHSFDREKCSLGDANFVRKTRLGVMEVDLRRIVGSVARNRDFDDKFLPLNKVLGPRWKEIYQVLQRKEYLGAYIPPVKLYMIDDNYFVNDGNHRISVAKFRGWETFYAEVTLLDNPPLRTRYT